MNVIIDDEIARLATEALSGGEIMQQAIILGQDALQQGDEARWWLGDLACVVQKRYRHNSIKMFADGLHVNPGTVREYRTVCLRFNKSVRAEIQAELPDLNYSDFRVAAKLIKEPGNAEQIEQARGLLKSIVDNEWTVAKAGVEVRKILGKEVTPKALLKTEGILCSISNFGKQLVFEIPAGLSGDLRQGMDVHLTVRSAEL